MFEGMVLVSFPPKMLKSVKCKDNSHTRYHEPSLCSFLGVVFLVSDLEPILCFFFLLYLVFFCLILLTLTTFQKNDYKMTKNKKNNTISPLHHKVICLLLCRGSSTLASS